MKRGLYKIEIEFSWDAGDGPHVYCGGRDIKSEKDFRALPAGSIFDLVGVSDASRKRITIGRAEKL